MTDGTVHQPRTLLAGYSKRMVARTDMTLTQEEHRQLEHYQLCITQSPASHVQSGLQTIYTSIFIPLQEHHTGPYSASYAALAKEISKAIIRRRTVVGFHSPPLEVVFPRLFR